MTKRFVCAALAVCGAILFQPSAQADENLSSRAIAALFPGSFEGVVHGLVQVRIKASRNGRLNGTMMGETDTGKWRISNGRLCVAWNDWTEGEYVCSSVRQDGDWFTANHGGTIRFRKL